MPYPSFLLLKFVVKVGCWMRGEWQPGKDRKQENRPKRGDQRTELGRETGLDRTGDRQDKTKKVKADKARMLYKTHTANTSTTGGQGLNEY